MRPGLFFEWVSGFGSARSFGAVFDLGTTYKNGGRVGPRLSRVLSLAYLQVAAIASAKIGTVCAFSPAMFIRLSPTI